MSQKEYKEKEKAKDEASKKGIVGTVRKGGVTVVEKPDSSAAGSRKPSKTKTSVKYDTGNGGKQ